MKYFELSKFDCDVIHKALESEQNLVVAEMDLSRGESMLDELATMIVHCGVKHGESHGDVVSRDPFSSASTIQWKQERFLVVRGPAL